MDITISVLIISVFVSYYTIRLAVRHALKDVGLAVTTAKEEEYTDEE